MPIPLIDIEAVTGRAEQGKTRPFICLGDDQHLYYVKGRGAGRRSLIAELLCGQLAKAFGLEIARFAVVDVPEALIRPIFMPEIAELGAGKAFGSQALPHVQELSFARLEESRVDGTISERMARDVFMFDWWVRNGDRTLTSKGGNPNLLWDVGIGQLVVIDHNCAFDPDFKADEAFALHVFADAGRAVFADMLERQHYAERFAAALATFGQACDNVPPEWWWVDHDVPANFDRAEAHAQLARFTDASFWEER